MSNLTLTRVPVAFVPEQSQTAANYRFVNLKYMAGMTNIRHKLVCTDGDVCYDVHFAIRMNNGETHPIKLSNVPAKYKDEAIELLGIWRNSIFYHHLNEHPSLIAITTPKFKIEEDEA